MTMGNAVLWFEVAGGDHEAQASFYTEMFDWTAVDGGGEMPYSLMQTSEGINGGVGAAPPGSEGHVTFYVKVDDLGAALEKAKSLGGTPVTEPMDVPGGQIAHFADPEGHFVGLMTGDGSLPA
jgi:predicted enzyme related to lactoylglutathione lyase